MIELGVPGFKCFLIHSGVDEFPAVTQEQVEEALIEMKGTEAVLLFHAECEVAEENPDMSTPCDPGLYSTFLESRPPAMELRAIQMVIDVCRIRKLTDRWFILTQSKTIQVVCTLALIM